MKSFTDEIIEETIKKPILCQCCRISFLCGLVMSSCEFEIKNKRPKLIFKLQNSASAEFVSNFLKAEFNAKNLETELVSSRFEIVLDELTSEKILDETGIFGQNGLEIKMQEDLFKCENCARTFLKAVFLSIGKANIKISENFNEKTGGGYKLSFLSHNENLTETLSNLLAENDISVSVVKSSFDSIYITDFESVKIFLYLLQANKAILQIESEAVTREMRAKANREVNATENNIKKTIYNNQSLLEIVKTIEDRIDIKTLPISLREICTIIKQKQNLTLNEIAVKLGGEIGKSGVNHRIRKLRKIYDSLVK